MLRFKTVYQDRGDGAYIGPRQHNGDFTWYPVIRTTDLADYGDQFKEKYLVSVSAVSLEELRRTGAINEVLGFVGRETDPGTDDLDLIWDAAEYSAAAPIWETTGNNYNKLMRAARREAGIACMLTGFVFDRAVNRIGATGWDFIAGNPLGTLAR